MTTDRGTPSTPTVCILTLCSDLTYLYGTLTTLQTIRTGFPTAHVFVLDNGSLIEAQSHIQRAAAQRGDWASIRGVWREQEAYFTGTGQHAHD